MEEIERTRVASEGSHFSFIRQTEPQMVVAMQNGKKPEFLSYIEATWPGD